MGISSGGTPLNLLYCLAVGGKVTEWPRMRGCLDARYSEIKVGWSRQTGQVDPTGLEWQLGFGFDIISGGRRFRLGSGWEEGPPGCPAAPPGGTHGGCSPAGVQGTPRPACITGSQWGRWGSKMGDGSPRHRAGTVRCSCGHRGRYRDAWEPPPWGLKWSQLKWEAGIASGQELASSLATWMFLKPQKRLGLQGQPGSRGKRTKSYSPCCPCQAAGFPQELNLPLHLSTVRPGQG